MNSWYSSFKEFLNPKVIAMLLFGFSAGLPLMLIFSSLGLWLREAGLERTAVTYFSWAALSYSFKFVWAPLIDFIPLPYLSNTLGRRRAWILISQVAIIVAIFLMAMSDPALGNQQLTVMAFAAVLLGFSSATQDIVIDAYRIESAPSELQALLSSTYIIGYRTAMIVSGAGTLFLAEYLGSTQELYSYKAWQLSYLCMCLVMLLGIFTTLMVKEPAINTTKNHPHSRQTYLRMFIVFILSVSGFIVFFHYSLDITSYSKNIMDNIMHNSTLSGFIIELIRLVLAIFTAFVIATLCIRLKFVDRNIIKQTYADPVTEFFRRYPLKLGFTILALICLYRISDIVLGVIANIFYQDLGYSKAEIGTVVKTFGVFMSILGGLIGGILSYRYGVIKILTLGAVLTVVTNLLFMLLADVGYNVTLLYFVISADNLSAGIASAAFIAFLSQLTNVSFTATQYAIFSSLMTLIPKIIGGYSGTIVDALGYSQFFLFASLLGIPVLGIIYLSNKYLKFN